MNYHNIVHDDMRNGSGLRVTLFVSGCEHHCNECHNPQTWNCESGIEFDTDALTEIFEQLDKEYISGITFSGGDPLHPNNVREIFSLIQKVRNRYKHKTVWIYTGYTWEEIMSKPRMDDITIYRQNIIFTSDVLVDGEFQRDKADVNYHWAGSANQRVIDIKKTLENNDIVLWK